jgi:copper homeostasis protein
MIRPRTGDFVYSTAELDVMLEDIRAFKTLGVMGVVLGVLMPDGTVNIGDTQRFDFFFFFYSNGA